MVVTSPSVPSKRYPESSGLVLFLMIFPRKDNWVHDAQGDLPRVTLLTRDTRKTPSKNGPLSSDCSEVKMARPCSWLPSLLLVLTQPPARLNPHTGILRPPDPSCPALVLPWPLFQSPFCPVDLASVRLGFGIPPKTCFLASPAQLGGTQCPAPCLVFRKHWLIGCLLEF